MGRKKLLICNINFEDNQTLKDKLLNMFNTYNLINCFNESHVGPYREVINHPNVKMLLKDKELLDTLNSFFENDLNITYTSKKLFLHRNTLIYRIEKIKKMVELDIRKFENAIIIKNLMYVNEIIG